MSAKPVITLKNISKTFRKETGEYAQALQEIDLEIISGEFFILVGPSGCGKSTLLRIMSGLEKTYEGSVVFSRGMTMKDTSFVFQQFALLPWLSVSENVEIALVARGVDREARKSRALEELKKLRLEKFASAHPRELSGGMRQRVGIARALATDPRVIFMDEPFSELDSFTAEELRKEFLGIWEETRPTIIMVSHLIEEALELADRIAILTPRPGKIEKIIANNLSRPRKKRSEDFYHLEDEITNLIKP